MKKNIFKNSNPKPIKYGELLVLISTTQLSPEALAPYFSVSNMTLRRWKQKSEKAIEPDDLHTIIQGVYQLVSQRIVEPQNLIVQKLLACDPFLYNKLVMTSLGINPAEIKDQKSSLSIYKSLSQIGKNSDKRILVDCSTKEIRTHEKHNKGWKKRLGILLKVLRANKFTLADKCVAYGALFYLITPFDFIPDHIPIFGLIDDYAILGIASAYYLEKYPDLLSKTLASTKSI